MTETAPSADPAKLSWGAERDGVCDLPLRQRRPVDWWVGEDNLIHVRLEGLGRTGRYKPRSRAIFDAIDEGGSLADIVEHAAEHGPERPRNDILRNARSLVHALVHQGNLEVVLPPVPAVFADRYERVEELGRGGVGVAWLCKDLQAGDRPVVVKHAWNFTGPFAERDRNLRNEAEVMRRLDHPGVVTLFDSFELEGRAHLVREYVEGHELSERVLSQGPPPPEERHKILEEVVEILDHMHKRGVVCLDLKPTNLMEQADGGLILSDLGHARILDGLKVQLQGAAGSRGYVAPEVWSKPHVASPASDLYSLGSLVVFLVVGRGPSQGTEVRELVSRLEDAGATAREVGIVRSLCQVSIEKRPVSCAEVQEILG